MWIAFVFWQFLSILRPPRMEAIPMFLYLCGCILLLQGLTTALSWCTGGLRQTSDSSTFGNIAYTIATLALSLLAFYVARCVSHAAVTKRAGVKRWREMTDDANAVLGGSGPECGTEQPTAAASPKAANP
jgi:hypothetical protein